MFSVVTQVVGVVDFSNLLGKFGVDWHLLLIQSLNFLLVAYLLYKFAFKNVVRMMDTRREKIESGLIYADKMKKEVDAFENSRAKRIESAKKEAEDIVKNAKSDAKTILEQEKVESRQIADNMVLSAEKEIALRHEKILQDAKSEISSLVVNIAESVLSAEMTDEQRDSYVLSAERILTSDRL